MGNADTEKKWAAITEELIPPTPPESWECCGSDCGEACVYSIYAREKAAYDEQVRLLNSFKEEDAS